SCCAMTALPRALSKATRWRLRRGGLNRKNSAKRRLRCSPDNTSARTKFWPRWAAAGWAVCIPPGVEAFRARVLSKGWPASFANDADRLRRFEQEAHATSALNHPNIMTIHDIGTLEGAPFIVAELLEGAELRTQLESGAIPTRKALEYAQQITTGLAAAH